MQDCLFFNTIRDSFNLDDFKGRYNIYLLCKIIKSGVLDGKTQYLTKGVWKFNVARLDKAIQENPKIFK